MGTQLGTNLSRLASPAGTRRLNGNAGGLQPEQRRPRPPGDRGGGERFGRFARCVPHRGAAGRVGGGQRRKRRGRVGNPRLGPDGAGRS